MAVMFACPDALRDKACFCYETVARWPGTHCVPGLLPSAEIIVTNRHALAQDLNLKMLTLEW